MDADAIEPNGISPLRPSKGEMYGLTDPLSMYSLDIIDGDDVALVRGLSCRSSPQTHRLRRLCLRQFALALSCSMPRCELPLPTLSLFWYELLRLRYFVVNRVDVDRGVCCSLIKFAAGCFFMSEKNPENKPLLLLFLVSITSAAAAATTEDVSFSDDATANDDSATASSSSFASETISTSITSDDSDESPSDVVRFCLSTLDSGNLDHTASGNMYSPSASYLERACSRVAE